MVQDLDDIGIGRFGKPPSAFGISAVFLSEGCLTMVSEKAGE